MTFFQVTHRFRPIKLAIAWQPALLHAAPVSLFILGLFYYWFAIADRYAIFLYGHGGVSAFEEGTRSRYWMSGLVACGAVMVLYILINWIFGRLAGIRYRSYAPPSWWQVWLLCTPFLVIGIPYITMTFNQPTLRPSDAASCLVIVLLGLALALPPGRLGAQNPLELGWLALVGLGLVPSLLLLRALELPAEELASVPLAAVLALGGTFAGVTWLLLLSWLRQAQAEMSRALNRFFPGRFPYRQRKIDALDAADGSERPRMVDSRTLRESARLLAAAFCLSYLLLPLLHHLYLTPPEHSYISSSANFFALNLSTQLISFLAAVILALGMTLLRQRREFTPERQFQSG